MLANEEVTADRRSERGNFPVFTRTLTQWKMRITAYADRLLDDLDRMDWPESIKTMQRNWIGRSTGATIGFPTEAEPIEVFTTRPDTLFGATFMVLAPEHPLADALAPEAWPESTPEEWTGGHETPAAALAAYREQAASVTDADRTAEDRTKTGVFTGGYATNPATGKSIPVFVADYVLMGYGTGAIMAVPGQDQRDWDFAAAYGLPVVRTVAPPVGFDGEAFVGEGPAINSANDDVSLNGLAVEHAKARIIDWLESTGRGRGTVNYKLRDWLFSRQRYWGEPFPIVYDETGLPVALPESMLPLELPEIDDYSPRTFDPDDADSQPEPPLGRATEWAEVELDLGDGLKKYRRELNTMPQWAGSCWYEIRYTDPTNAERFVDREVERYWMGPRDGGDASTGDPGGVDLYVGGVEHAVLHLLYARFWHKVLYDLGEVSSAEPFRRLFNQGYVQAYAYRDARGFVVPAAEVVDDGKGGYTWQGQPVRREAGKMGKSLKNVVTPDEIFEQYGADTFRLYEMSTGPLDADRPWETRAVVGSQRFLQRMWRLVVDERTGELLVGDAADPGRGERRPGRRLGGRRDAEPAAPHHRPGDRGLHRAAVQHRGGPADRAEQPADRAGRLGPAAPEPGRADGAAGRAAGAARGRGAVVPAGAQRVPGLPPVPGGGPGPDGGRDGAVPGAGQRQAARQDRGAGRRRGRRDRGGGAGPGRAQPGRAGAQAGDRGARPDRHRRRRVETGSRRLDADRHLERQLRQGPGAPAAALAGPAGAGRGVPAGDQALRRRVRRAVRRRAGRAGIRGRALRPGPVERGGPAVPGRAGGRRPRASRTRRATPTTPPSRRLGR